jgi:hypothetical protein
MYPTVHYQDDESPIVVSYRHDLSVTIELFTEAGEDLHIVLGRRNAADIKNLLDIWLER